MQEHPLIGLRQFQRVTHLFGRPPQHVTEPKHLGLHGRQGIQRLPDHTEGFRAQQPVFGIPVQSDGIEDADGLATEGRRSP